MYPNKNKSQTTFYHPEKYVYVISAIIALLSIAVVFSFKLEGQSVVSKKPHFTQKDSIASKKAFLKVYAVLMSPAIYICKALNAGLTVRVCML